LVVETPLIWSTATEIAERDGVSQQAVSKAIAKFAASGELPVERDGRGRIVRVSLAHYDHHRERFTNPAKAKLRPVGDLGPAGPANAAADSFEEARRQNEWLKVTREKLRHQEELKQLVRADVIAEAQTIAGREIQAIIMRLPNRADDIALAVSREGQSGARILLRTIAFELAEQIADRLGEIAAAAPAGDPPLEDDAP
jgi:DNA-binding transcriptional ArsR family regulator